MDTKLVRLQVFLASPSDLAEERALLPGVIEEVNRTIAFPAGLFLELVRWETHARPGVGRDAQDVVNQQIGPKDLFIGVMWTRLGTPTSRAESGTQEEFERAYEAWAQTGKPKILLYFKTKPFFPRNSEEIEQLQRVFQFRRTVEERGALYWQFAEAAEFATVMRKHLTQELQAMIRDRTPDKPDSGLDRDVSSRSASGNLAAREIYDSPSAIAVRPTLLIVYRPDGWHLENKGRGTALDILVAQKHVKGQDRGQWFNPVRVPALAAGEQTLLTWLEHENETGLGASYSDEDGRPFTSVTGNDVTTVLRERAFPHFREDQIRRDWHFFK